MKRSIWIPLLIVAAILIIGTSQYPKLSIATGMEQNVWLQGYL